MQHWGNRDRGTKNGCAITNRASLLSGDIGFGIAENSCVFESNGGEDDEALGKDVRGVKPAAESSLYDGDVDGGTMKGKHGGNGVHFEEGKCVRSGADRCGNVADGGNAVGILCSVWKKTGGRGGGGGGGGWG